jgi:hypothetical protein
MKAFVNIYIEVLSILTLEMRLVNRNRNIDGIFNGTFGLSNGKPGILSMINSRFAVW